MLVGEEPPPQLSVVPFSKVSIWPTFSAHTADGRNSTAPDTSRAREHCMLFLLRGPMTTRSYEQLRCRRDLYRRRRAISLPPDHLIRVPQRSSRRFGAEGPGSAEAGD